MSSTNSRPSLGGSSSLATLQQRGFVDQVQQPDHRQIKDRSQQQIINAPASTKLQQSQADLPYQQQQQQPQPQNHSQQHFSPSQQNGQQNHSFRSTRDTTSSPAFSIDAVSDSSEDDMLSALIRHTNKINSSHSPHIGDLTWSSEETGPFGVMPSSSSGPNTNTTTTSRSTAAPTAANIPTSSSKLDTKSSSFDLEGAIADLLEEDEMRRKAKRAAGFASTTPDTQSRVSSPETGSRNLTNTTDSTMKSPSVLQTPLAASSSRGVPVRSETSTTAVLTSAPPLGRFQDESVDLNNNGPEWTPRRTRHGSSPGSKTARLPSSTSSTSVRAKRSSSSSIAQSLLRGSLPLGVADEYEGRLDGADDAAEALRKLDGIMTPRSSRQRDPSRSPRSSKQLSRPGSAGRRTPGNTSRASSPSVKSVHTAAPRHQREESASASRSASAARRASRTLGKTSTGKSANEDHTASPATTYQTIDSPRRTSLSSPRAKRSQLPPMPVPSANVSLGLATPPSSAAPLASSFAVGTPSSSSANPHITNPVQSAKRASGASVMSSASMGPPRTSTSNRSKRASEVSLAESQHQSAGANGSMSNAGLGLMTTSSPGASGSVDESPMSPFGVGDALAVPPVPPLPKAWESSRSMSSFASDATLPVSPSGAVATAAYASQPVPRAPSPGGAPSEVSGTGPQDTPQSNKSPSLKWSFSNLSTTLASKKSDEKLSSRKSMPAEQFRNPALATPLRQAPSSARASLRPEKRASQAPSSSARSTMVPAADTSNEMSASSYTMSSSNSSLSATTPTSISQARTSNDRTSTRSPSTTASPKVRRTPSFFRKRSSEATRDDTTRRGKKSPLPGRQAATESSTTHEDNDNAQPTAATAGGAPRSDATTPSGRSSRKSILGLGSLLRSASRRNVDSMPSSASATQGMFSKAQQMPNGGPVGDDSVISQDSTSSKTPSSKSSGGPLGSMRRASLIGGRKRGKTLPSSQDTPQKPDAHTLPPMQMPPLADAPISPPRQQPTTGNAQMHSGSVDSSGNRRRLTNSSSTGSLNVAAGRDRANVPALPTINASPSTVVSTSEFGVPSTYDGSSLTAGKRVVSGGNASLSGAAPASRIPRATLSSSQRQTMSSSQSSSTVRRLSGTSGLPTSKTSASLASHLGIASKNVENDGTMSYTNESTMQSSSPLASNAGGSSSTLVSILNAYTNAKTAAEVEVVLRRAKVASYSSALLPREREVLASLVTRQEDQKRYMEQASQNDSSSAQKLQQQKGSPSVANTPQSQRSFVTTGSTIEKTPTYPRSSTAGLSSSVGPSAASLPSSVPARKTRVSMVTTSAAARAAREAAAAAASGQPISRLSTPSSARDSPALSDALAGRSNSTLSPSPLTVVNPIDEEEREGDEEIEAYIRRRHSRKVAQGARLADLEKLLEFPEDEKPAKAYSYRQAEALWGDKLTSAELDEIRSYKEIFFCGQSVDKNGRIPTDGAPTQNSGYDDERGDYLVLNHDHLAFRYEVLGLLGRGSFGQVLQCKDHKTGRHVAIKLIRNKRRFHHQALVEVKILENLTKWDPNEEYNVIKVLDSFYFRNHLCISMELLSINLYELIKANSFAGFSTKLIRRITSQVLASLSLLRRQRVVHCDLKPENILLKHPRKSGIKVIDFGSSCFEHEKVYTYIQSRFYRSPEVILGMNYHTAIDIWSLGCIIAELYSGYPLFPGENEQEQLACIMEILGVPERYLIDRSSRKKLFFDSTGAPRPVVNSKGKRRRPNTKTLGSALNCNDELFIDFLAKCLHWDPERRLKPDAALRHPWIRRGAVGVSGKMIAPSAVEVTSARRVSILPSSNTTTGAAMTQLSNGAPVHTARRAAGLSSSATSASLSSGVGGARAGLPVSASTSKVGSTANGQPAAFGTRHERRMSLRSSVNGASVEAPKHTPLRSSQRNQQPVQ